MSEPREMSPMGTGKADVGWCDDNEVTSTPSEEVDRVWGGPRQDEGEPC